MPIKKKNNVLIFYGGDAPFSNMYICAFKDHSGRTFNCVEQYYQYNKALTFGNVDLANRVMEESSPVIQKRLGGSYFQGFNVTTWNTKRFEVMFFGNMYKYQQNEHLLTALLDTGYSKLGEASERDIYWGIGLSLGDTYALNPSCWNGENQMGILLKNY